MIEAFDEVEVAISLMKEALTMLDAPEAAPAANLLQMAIKAASEIAASKAGVPLDGATDPAKRGE
jgi:hypothetical protein